MIGRHTGIHEEEELEESVAAPPDELTAEEMTSGNIGRVDFSGQGLTLVPVSLFRRMDIVYLNLSANNIRSIPSDIVHLSQLRCLDLSRNGLRCNGAQDFVALPRELAQLTHLEELNISECNLMHLPATVFLLSQLLRLDISRNKVNRLAPDIGNLMNLRVLNAQQTGLTTLPMEIVCCEELQCLNLFGNHIEQLPESMRELLQLKKLTLNYRHFCTTLDEHVDIMLRKGQIQSDHVPLVVFEMPKLQRLDLDRCQLNCLPDTVNHGLERINLAHNYFFSVPSSLLILSQLTYVDLSFNFLTELPDGIQQLHGLIHLSLRGNQLASLPPSLGKLALLDVLDVGENSLESIPPELATLKAMRKLYVDRNNINEVPNFVCELTALDTLDLSQNQLTYLPLQMHQLLNIQTSHSFVGLFRTGLWLHGNNISEPPPEIWRTCQPKDIWNYLKELAIRRVENVSTLKVILIGNHQCGKSSFLNTLIQGHAHLTKSEVDTTRAFELRPWVTKNNVNLCFVDIGMHKVYDPLLSKLLDPDALYLLMFDAAAYKKSQNFDEHIGYWLNLLQQFCPGAVVKVIGLKRDLLETPPESTAEAVEEDVAAEYDVAAETEEEGVQLTEELGAVEETLSEASGENDHNELQSESADVIEQLKLSLHNDLEQFERDATSQRVRYGNVAYNDTKLRIQQYHGDTFPLYSVVTDSQTVFIDFQHCLEYTAIDKSLFPFLQRIIPPSWCRLQQFLKANNDFKITFSQIMEQVQRDDDSWTETQMRDCLLYLNNCGKVLWIHWDVQLREVVFTRPSVIRQTLARLLRMDMPAECDYDTNLLFKCRGNLSRNQFEEVREMLLSYGEFSYPAMKCLLLSLSGDRKELLLFQEIASLFQIAYCLPLPTEQASSQQLLLYNYPLLVVPHLNQTPKPDDFHSGLWPHTLDSTAYFTQHRRVVTFPLCHPPGLFENLSCGLHKWVELRLDWSNLVYANHAQADMLLEMRILEQGEYCIAFKVRYKARPLQMDFLNWFDQYVECYLQLRPNLLCIQS